jgi:myosin heavy subunit
LTAILQLLETKNSQSIVISGESGSGKTESAKQAMNCITYYFGKGNKSDKKTDIKKTTLEDEILDCNPILEAFGNATTVRNPNSSRFGKYVTISIDLTTGKIEGAKIQTYLLEKSRVCEPSEKERNYHIFYHLLKGGSAELLSSLHLERDPTKYDYLKQTGLYEVDGINDSELYQEVNQKFLSTGFTIDEIGSIFRICAACLHIGNLKFVDKESGPEIHDRNLFNKICSLLQVNPELLETSLTCNVRVVSGEVIKSSLKYSESISFRNVLAKDLYNRIFNWIVKKLNKKLSTNQDKDDPNKKYIGLLDIFGFENFTVNSLEQFCINFTNEKLQQLYIRDIFKSEQDEFLKQGLKEYLSEIPFKDNQAIIESMDYYKSSNKDLSPNGIFQNLDDCSLQKKKDKEFLDQLKLCFPNDKNQQHPIVKISKISTDKFTIIHTAKNVEYSTNNFVNKNLDEVKPIMSEAIENSSDNNIKYILNEVNDESEYKAKKQKQEEEANAKSNLKTNNKYIGAKFRVDMNSLMTELSTCQCHYVRCLKPNEDKTKEIFHPQFVFNQIRYLGILDTIRIRKDGYPCRKKFRDFFFRFEDVAFFKDRKSVLEYKKITDDYEFKNLSIKVLDSISPNRSTKDCLVGGNIIFMKQKYYSLLEMDRAIKIKKKENAVTKIVKMWKGSVVRRRFLNMKKCANYLKGFFRTQRFYIITKKKRKAARKIQATFRMHLSRLAYKHQVVCIYKIQKKVKSFLRIQKTRKIIKAAAFLVKQARKFLIKVKKQKVIRMRNIALSIVDRAWAVVLFKLKKLAAIRIQAHVRGFLAKIKHFSKVLKGRKKRENYIQDKAANIIQRDFRMFWKKNLNYLRNVAADKIQGYWKMTKYTFLIKGMRTRTLILQKNIRIYLSRKHALDKRMGEFLKEENLSTDKLQYETSKIIFPSLASLQDREIQEFFDDDIQSEMDSKKKIKPHLPEYDPYGEAKIIPFCKVLDVDILVFFFNLDGF